MTNCLLLVPAIYLALLVHGSYANPVSGFQRIETDWERLSPKLLKCTTQEMTGKVEKHLVDCKAPADDAAKENCSKDEDELLKTLEECKPDAELIDKCSNEDEETTTERVQECVSLTSHQILLFKDVYSPCLEIVGGMESMHQFVKDCSNPSDDLKNSCMKVFHVSEFYLAMCWEIVNVDITKAISAITPLKDSYSAKIREWEKKGVVSCWTTNQDDLEEIERSIEECKTSDRDEDIYDCKVYLRFKEWNIPRATERVEERCQELETFSKKESTRPVKEIFDDLQRAKAELKTANEKCVLKIKNTVQEADKVLSKYANEKDEAKKNEFKKVALDSLWGLRTCLQIKTTEAERHQQEEEEEVSVETNDGNEDIDKSVTPEKDITKEPETEQVNTETKNLDKPVTAEKDIPKEPGTLQTKTENKGVDKPALAVKEKPETVQTKTETDTEGKDKQKKL